MSDVDEVWVSEACTLPTADRPFRLGEFDELFATSLKGASRVSPTVLRWFLDPGSEMVARDLAVRETECCSFFTFAFSSLGDMLIVDVEVPATQVLVLDALAARADGMTPP